MKTFIFKLIMLAAMGALLPAAVFASVTLKPATRAVPPAGGAGIVVAVFTAEAGTTVSLSPASSESWLTVVATQPVSGTVSLRNGAGTGKVTYRVARNDSGVPRSATLTVAGATLTVNQAGRPCNPAISAPVSRFSAGGGEASFNVKIAAGCPWTVTLPEGIDWVVVTEGDSGTGTGQVTFTARENVDPVARTIALSVTATHPVSGAVTVTRPHRVVQKKKTAATPLTVAKRVTVVDAREGAPAAGIKSLAFGVQAVTDYENDVTRRFIEERSSEAFATTNEILCMIAQSRYDAMLNKGPYTALIDAKLCRKGQETSTSDTQAASQAPEYITWTVDSSRASDTAPQVVKAWIHEKGSGTGEGGMDKLIKARLTITEGVTTENPYGIFSVNFAGYPVTDTGTLPTPAMKGTLKSERDASGRVVLRFVEGEEGPNGGGKAAAFRKETDGSGSGSVESRYGDRHDAFDFSFNTDYFRRVNGTNDVCLDRNAFTETAWRYGLYDLSGARVNLASGFPIRVDKDGKRLYGWVGYWGVWLPGEAALVTGDEVFRQSFTGEPDATPYQVIAPGGKLMKHTRATTTLDDIRNTPLNLWIPAGAQGEAGSYRAAWNGTTFVIDAIMGNQGWSFLPSPFTFDVSTIGQPEIQFWSESLSGSVRLRLDCTGGGPDTGFTCSGPSGSAEAVYYREEPVFPGDPVPAAFACMEGCLDSSLLSTGNPFRSDPLSFQNVPPTEALYISYPFDSTSMVLKEGETPLVTTITAQQWGVSTGPLFAPTAENLAHLACPWNSSSTCAWQAGSELPVFYTWGTGGNPWNRLTILVDPDGVALRFDPPIRVAYLHSQPDTQAPDAKYDGVRMSLEYAGFGQLQGIPGGCYDEAGIAVQCGDGTRFIADFVIAAGTTVSDERSGASYLVKPLEIGQFMKRVSSGCESLDITPYSLPSLSSWSDPAIGTEPTVSGAPAVVGGVLR